MNHKEAIKIRIEKAKELVEDKKISEKVEVFQSTFFNYERLKERLNHYQKVIKDKKSR